MLKNFFNELEENSEKNIEKGKGNQIG